MEKSEGIMSIPEPNGFKFYSENFGKGQTKVAEIVEKYATTFKLVRDLHDD